ncbi:MAG: hypothetical protein HW421_1486 [Ignavibacteria bacterium]|nr:hypothetical protein [Ignavibacteria bacterium]
MKLLLLLSGNKDRLLTSHNLESADFDVIKLDEKELAKPLKMIRLIKSKRWDAIYFGTIENILQRFHFLMKLYILFSYPKQGSIIDESGNEEKYLLSEFLFFQCPKAFFEIIYSMFVIVYYYIKLPIIRCHYVKKH